MIETTNFTAMTKSENAIEVENWLNANKEGYFNTIDNTDDVLTITTIDNGSIVIKPYETTWSFTLKNGTNQEIQQNYGNQLRKGIKTSKGLVLVTNSNGVIFIVKTNEDTIGTVFIRSYEDNTLSDYYFADFSNSTTFKHDASNLKKVRMNMTSLASVPLGDSGTYAIGLYYVPFYQYTNTGIISYNGISYWYNSWFTIQE